MTDLTVLDEARAWLADDPDPTTRAELIGVLSAAESGDSAALADLGDRFAGRLTFGTAGLRGAMGAGPNRMNRVVVIQAAAGLAAYLRAQQPGPPGLVVIGYDARFHSDMFAVDTAAVMVAAGLRAAVLPTALPTPVLAYAIRHLGAVAGVMVTASHNPPQDNGYKVYLGDGAQIVPPADTQISAHIDAAGPVAAIPRADDGWEVLGPEVEDAYLDRVAAVVGAGGPRAVSIAYTPMHGVGGPVLAAAFERAGFAAPAAVAAQAQPDPTFPTVAFPNPEEAGAMDMAFGLAASTGADIVLANDPDADRCAVGIPHDGGWRTLRGDEVGALLGWHIARRTPGLSGTMACSIVSSTMLAAIAAAHGLRHTETLTGFKWISRAADDLVFGYEEALGYCVDPDAVLDKDGISASLLVAELAAELKAVGRTLADALDDLDATYGVHLTAPLTIRVDDLAEIATAMATLRAAPPVALGGLDVTAYEDLAEGVGGLPPTEGVRLRLTGPARVVVRPSGTEPKLKCYLEAVVPVEDDLAAARALAAQRLAAIRADLAAALGVRDDR